MAGENVDPTWTLMLLIGSLCLVGFLVWWGFRDEFLEAIRYIRLAEIAVIAPFNDQADACFTWLREAKVGNAVPTSPVITASLGCFGPKFITSLPSTAKMTYFSVTPDSLGYIGRLVGSYLRWILVPVCAFVVYYALYKTDRNKFRTAFGLESFIKVQAKVWPVIAPIVNFNPAKSSSRVIGDPVPSKLPLFAESLAPEEWLSYHQVNVVKSLPEREAMYSAFAMQLGPRWAGYGKLPPYIQALVAAFALKGVQKRDESDELLGRISLCWSDKKGFKLTPELASEIKGLLKDPKVGGEAQKIIEKHAYRSTAVLGMLKWARFMGGVLASAQFLWLRGVDRHLWYALNNLGRRSFHTEGSGAMAHYMAEEIAQKALVVPRLETAIVTMNKYVSEKQPEIPPYSEGTKITRRT